jgi:hydrogenase nickel incorporation protein HypB
VKNDVRLIDIRQEILSDNKGLAETLRERLVGTRTFLLNLMSSPGSGKTSLILRTIGALGERYRIGVIEADIAAAVDAETIVARGIPAVQLRTGGLCHVDAAMVEKALESLDTDALDLIILENVGNLVCPAEFDTGAFANAMILSVPEGDDKPIKYPLMFSTCDVVVLNKTDFLDRTDFDVAAVRERLAVLNRRAEVIELSCRTGEGTGRWCEWLEGRVETLRRS